MKKIKKRLLSLILVICLSLETVTPVFAAETDTESMTNESIVPDDYTLDVDKMTPEQKEVYDEVINEAIEKYSADDPNFNEQEFIDQVNQVLLMMEYGAPVTRALVSIPNSVVATAINVAIAALTGGVAGAAIKAYIKKVGIGAAVDAIADKVIIALAAFGIKEVTGITAVIKDIVNNVLDPGSTIAKWLDKKDSKPGNGKVEIG